MFRRTSYARQMPSTTTGYPTFAHITLRCSSCNTEHQNIDSIGVYDVWWFHTKGDIYIVFGYRDGVYISTRGSEKARMGTSISSCWKLIEARDECWRWAFDIKIERNSREGVNVNCTGDELKEIFSWLFFFIFWKLWFEKNEK